MCVCVCVSAGAGDMISIDGGGAGRGSSWRLLKTSLFLPEVKLLDDVWRIWRRCGERV